MDETTQIEERRDRGVSGGRLVFGVALVLLGGYFLFDQLGMVELDLPWRWWPLILVAMGLARVASPGDEGRRGGVWLIVIGLWLLANFHGWAGLTWESSWPLLLVAAGAMIVWRSVSERETPRRKRRREVGR
jgi:hypothetical protein